MAIKRHLFLYTSLYNFLQKRKIQTHFFIVSFKYSNKNLRTKMSLYLPLIMNVTLSKVLKAVSGYLAAQPLFLFIDDNMVEKEGDIF